MTSPAASPPSAPPRTRVWDRHLLAVALLGLAVFVTRAHLVGSVHSYTFDTPYHVDLGLAWWKGDLATRAIHDPPLGGAVMVIPMLLTGCYDPAKGVVNTIEGHRLSADVLAHLIAVWKGVYLAPLVPICFAWARRLYGLAAGWVCAAAVIVEPNIAGHVAPVSNDVLGALAVAAGALLAWRYFERPTAGRLVAMAVAVPVSLMLKATAIALLPIVGLYAVLWWGIRPWRERVGWAAWRAALPRRLGAVAAGVAVGVVALLAVTRFELAPPLRPNAAGDWGNSRVAQVLRKPWPAGVYVRSVAAGAVMSRKGHHGYLLGEARMTGWWYYFPVTAAVKVPVPLLLLIGLGAASFLVARPRFDDWAVLVPLGVIWFLLLTSAVNIGVRHLLPAIVFMLILGARFVTVGRVVSRAAATAAAGTVTAAGRWRSPAVVAGVLVAAAGAHAATYHPDYLSYFNLPYRRPWLIVNDSSIDMGQASRQAAAWAAARPPGRPVHVCFFRLNEDVSNPPGQPYVEVTPRNRPTTGLLVVSPIMLIGIFDPADPLAALRQHDPDELIGHSLLVYDLDRLGGGRPFAWPPLPHPLPPWP